MSKLKPVKKSDNVVLFFGEWFDKVNGNTYYDVEISIGEKTYTVKWGYGYNAGDNQSIDEALQAIGYRVRVDTVDRHAPYKHLKTFKANKLKRELFKETGLQG